MAKVLFWTAKQYKVFYTCYHSAQQNKLFALIKTLKYSSSSINIIAYSAYVVLITIWIPTSVISNYKEPL